jgi:hypothetical protein
MEKTKSAVDSAVDGIKKVAIGDKQDKKPKVKKQKRGDGGEDAGPLELSPQPQFIDHRVTVFEKLKVQYDADIAAKPRVPIKITMIADGKPGREVDGTAWETSKYFEAHFADVDVSLFETHLQLYTSDCKPSSCGHCQRHFEQPLQAVGGCKAEWGQRTTVGLSTSIGS